MFEMSKKSNALHELEERKLAIQKPASKSAEFEEYLKSRSAFSKIASKIGIVRYIRRERAGATLYGDSIFPVPLIALSILGLVTSALGTPEAGLTIFGTLAAVAEGGSRLLNRHARRFYGDGPLTKIDGRVNADGATLREIMEAAPPEFYGAELEDRRNLAQYQRELTEVDDAIVRLRRKESEEGINEYDREIFEKLIQELKDM